MLICVKTHMFVLWYKQNISLRSKPNQTTQTVYCTIFIVLCYLRVLFLLALDSQKLEHFCLLICLLTGTLFGFNLALVSDEVMFSRKNNVAFKQNFIKNTLRKIPKFHH